MARRPQYVPLTGYTEKLTTMLAGGNPPDVAYMTTDLAWNWAMGGKTLDLAPYVKKDAETAALLPNITYSYSGGKVMATSLAASNQIFYYNKTLFKEAGLPAPPTKGDQAWAWDQFLDAAKKLTKDQNGRNAADPKFDPKNIQTYGTTLPLAECLYWSNGGRLASEDGTKFLLNQPNVVDVLQKMQDLIYVQHVTPTPSVSQSSPAINVLLQTKKVAMVFSGTWTVLDLSHTSGLEWGMAVYPKFQQPVTLLAGTPMIISAATKNPEAAYEFYRWRYSPERINLYEIGLWMPIVKEYYTQPDKIKEWLDPTKGVYPAEALDVLVDYSLHYAPNQDPPYWLKNYDQIDTKVLTPAYQALWANQGTAQKIMDDAATKIAPLLQGRW